MAAQDEYAWYPDWWSRLMALGSLLVAGVALWYARFELPDKLIASRTDYANLAGQLEQDRTQFETLLGGLRQETEASAGREERFEQICRRLELLAEDTESSIAAADRAPRIPAAPVEPSDLLQPPESAKETYHPAGDLQRIPGTPLVDTAEPEVSGADEVGADEAADGDDLADDTPDGVGRNEEALRRAPGGNDRLESGQPDRATDTLGMMADDDSTRSLLQVVRSALRPLESERAVTMTVRNMGQKPAVISQVRFEPVDIIEDVPTELAAMPWGQSSPAEWVLVLEPSDNLAHSKDQQGTYVRTLAEPLTIPAGQQIDMRIAIHNPDHLGYGLLGRFRLEFNVTESLELPNLAVAFVGTPPAADQH